MPNLSPLRLFACIALLTLMRTSTAQEAGSSWSLRLLDMDNQLKTEATLAFTNESVKSCMRGKWKRVTVASPAGADVNFFPLSAPLAYKVEHDVLTVAQTQNCRPYLVLTGISTPRDIHGTYKRISIARVRQFGIFTLRPVQ